MSEPDILRIFVKQDGVHLLQHFHELVFDSNKSMKRFKVILCIVNPHQFAYLNYYLSFAEHNQTPGQKLMKDKPLLALHLNLLCLQHCVHFHGATASFATLDILEEELTAIENKLDIHKRTELFIKHLGNKHNKCLGIHFKTPQEQIDKEED